MTLMLTFEPFSLKMISTSSIVPNCWKTARNSVKLDVQC